MKLLLMFIAGATVATGVGEVWPGGKPDFFESIPPKEVVPITLPPRCTLVIPDGRKFTWEPRADGWCHTEDLR